MAPFDPRPVAARFWERAGVAEPFPRQLAPTIAAILPVVIVLLPSLSVAQMSEWFARRGVGCISLTGDRPLRGCLIAQRGHAFIFVDGCLQDDERRLTLAHELAHFLHHYEAPRNQALALVGAQIRPVLDGDRVPTPGEKLRAALRGVPIGVYEHTLERSDEGLPDAVTSRLESEADLVAFELLAPSAAVTSRTRPGDERRSALVEYFGLPAWAAARWGAWLEARRDGGNRFIARLEAARKKSAAAMSNTGPGQGTTETAADRRKP